MSLTLEQMRPLVWQALSQATQAGAAQPQVTNFSSTVCGLAQHHDLEPERDINNGRLTGGDDRRLRAILFDLQVAGIIVPGIDVSTPTLPWFQVTDHGVQCLAAGQITPYDPSGYLARLQAEIPQLDATVVAYLAECLDCLRRQCLRACAVMLGGAAEQTLLLLIDAVHQAIQDLHAKQRFAQRAIKERNLKRRFDALQATLAPIVPTLPYALSEDLSTKLDGIFVLIRKARNEAGHPAASGPISRDDAHAHLLLFPSYCRRAHDLMAHFALNPI